MQTNQPDILEDKKERNDFYIALITIVLTGVFITQTSLISHDKASAQKAISTTDIVTETEDRTSKYLLEDKEIERPVERTIAPVQKQSPVAPFIYHTSKEAPIDQVNFSSAAATKTQEVKNVLGDIATEEEEEASEEAKEVIAEEVIAEEVIAEVKEADTDIVEEIKSETKEITEEDNKKIEKETPEIIEEAKSVIQETKAVLSSALDKKDFNKKDCVIAIGLYEEPKNVSTLRSRLESEGFDVFTKDLSRLTQVGVYISCDPTMSKSVLSEIQEIYAKDAFIVER